jgi:uncharacterized protein (DUF2345 family)
MEVGIACVPLAITLCRPSLVVDGDTATLVGVPWFIRTHDGRTFSGRLDDQGQLPRVITDSEQQYEAYWGDAAIVEMELVKA